MDGVTSYTFTVPIIGDLNTERVFIVVYKYVVDIIEEPFYGSDYVVESEQGLRYDNTPVKPARSVPENALELEIAPTESESFFFSLGFQEYNDGGDPTTAYIVLEFDNPIIVNGDGPDLRVVEDTWGLPYPNEKADIYVSNDLINWVFVGKAVNQNPINSYHTISDFELPVGMESAKYVAVQDASLRADFASKYPSQAATLDGFDLNAVLAIHGISTTIMGDETAWAAEEVGVSRFVEKGDWGTYFNYVLK